MSIFRQAQLSDRDALLALYRQVFDTDAEEAEMAVCRLAGEQNIVVAEGGGSLKGMLLTLPVSIENRKGVCFAGLCVQPNLCGRGIGGGLLEYAAEEQRKAGAAFAVMTAARPEQLAFGERHGFQKAFPLRHVQREIKRNIWSQAEFDSVPAKKLCALRREYCPSVVQLSDKEMIPILTRLYSRGITIVSSDEGYGLYFRDGETLQFIELMADGDRAAESLMEAAREKEVVVERADIRVGADQNLFLGEGSREDHGMIRFFSEPFDVSESYLRLILDV